MFKAMKFMVRDEQQSKALQEVLFKLGYQWNGCGKTLCVPESNELYTELNGYLLFNNDDSKSYYWRTTNTHQDTEAFIAEHSPKDTKEMTEFKAGDKVVCVDASNDGIAILAEGKQYIVVTSNPDHNEVYIKVMGTSISYSASRFKLVSSDEAIEAPASPSKGAVRLVNVFGKLYRAEDVEKALEGLEVFVVSAH